jgi:glycosyltransferase involved in cell wall biosynthesis
MSKRRLRIAFADLESAGWTAGGHYLRNLFSGLHAIELECRPEIVLVRTSLDLSVLSSYADQTIICPAQPFRYNVQKRLVRELPSRIQRWVEPQPPLVATLHENTVDCFFSLDPMGPKFHLPVLTWIPDFQHKHLPEMFSESERRTRDELFQRTGRYATRVVLSSQTVLRDYEDFAKRGYAEARVVSFVAQVPTEIYKIDSVTVCKKYNLPERFFYLPNQFWKHKNHQVVIEALALACARRPQLTVVCTGNTHDYRHPHYFAQMLAQIAERNLRHNLIILGLVEHSMTYQLMRQAIAVLQPSLFEGWSTTIEEAKSLGKRVIASDIAIHREQNPAESRYFIPQNAQSLADTLVDTFDTIPSGPDMMLEQAARDLLPKRTRTFGQTFVNLCAEVVQS